MMKSRFAYYVALLTAIIFFLTGCGTSRRSSRNVTIGNLSGKEYMEQVIAWSPSRTNLTAKAAVILNIGTNSPLKVNANMRIRRNEVIRFTVAPLLGIEVARVDVTPEDILIVDRMNKRYTRVNFQEISSLLNTKLDFNILQSLFLNEIFLPGKNSLTVADASEFDIKPIGSQAQLSSRSYTFLTSAADGRLEETCISVKNTPFALRCLYSAFTSLSSAHGNDIFPQNINMMMEGTPKQYSLQLGLSKLGTDSNWDSTTQLSSKYTFIPLTEILKSL